ncbi:NUDIX domain-containing protein [Roseobacter sp. N2S]|uniref:NUDIX domain-containing protein n=1 Tax=Roseobacter sp. N2S TaxID=2663844 RepID=UPI00285A5E72|nr:NUDIX domain-containing protein [Roseobacter sp. N2S]MDR6263859.1 8-oxo-dGTP pyrophosphatase MutT (NUDIX family) [Roseobacter sp. N2S]
MSGDFVTLGDWAETGKQAAGVILLDQHSRLLMQLRDINERTAGPGLWSIFGGEVEAGETLQAAALREFAEETGLILPPTALTPLARALSLFGTRLYAFTATISVDPSQIRLGEGAGFAFLTRVQIESLPLMPAAGAILRHYFATLDTQN